LLARAIARPISRRPVLVLPAILPERGVLLLLLIDELLPGIAVFAARTPIPAALLRDGRRIVAAGTVARRIACSLPIAVPRLACARVAERFPAAPIIRPNTRGLGRLPQLAAREPLHLRVRMLFADPLERRQQLFALRGAKGGREAAGDDRPVGVTGWHKKVSGIRNQGVRAVSGPGNKVSGCGRYDVRKLQHQSF
jgi:hypothetical protein